MKNATHFSADAEIESKAQDLLGRARFAEEIAARLSAWNGRQSLVVALNGPWGSGKSSVKNMIIEALLQQPKLPEVLHFNPWQWREHQQLSKAFFAEVGKKLGILELRRLKLFKTRAAKWRLYAACLNIGGFAARGYKDAFTYLLGGGALLLFGESQFIQNGWAQNIGVVTGALALCAGTFKLFAELATHISEAYLRYVEYREKSLDEIKDDLACSLLDIRKTILVVVDDIDRLPADEIACVFQLIKANANFPNLL